MQTLGRPSPLHLSSSSRVKSSEPAAPNSEKPELSVLLDLSASAGLGGCTRPERPRMLQNLSPCLSAEAERTLGLEGKVETKLL